MTTHAQLKALVAALLLSHHSDSWERWTGEEDQPPQTNEEACRSALRTADFLISECNREAAGR